MRERVPEPALLQESLQGEPLVAPVLLRQLIPRLPVLQPELILWALGPPEFLRVEPLIRPFPGFR